MKIAIFGLGYVGSVSSACLAELGHEVIGVDVQPAKVAALEAGESPIVERGLPRAIRSMRQAGRLRATVDSHGAIAASELSMICVGTPSTELGDLDLTYVRRIAAEVAEALRKSDRFHVVMLRSTVLPGTVEEQLIPLLESGTGKSCGTGFGVAYNPEFLREGSAIQDFKTPPYTVIAGSDPQTVQRATQVYEGVDAPLHETTFRVAEMLKYVNNTFHALKVTFGNEIGHICKEAGIDSHQVMDLFCQDTKLNISPAYLRPGFAFGGSCLPKDLRALTSFARQHRLDVPLLNSILFSNRSQVDHVLGLINRAGKRRIGVLGLTFKAGTDDIRESPIIKVVEALVGRGLDVRVHDTNINIEAMVGKNRAFLEAEIPYLASIMQSSIEDVVAGSDLVLVATDDPAYRDVAKGLGDDQILVDLVRLSENGAVPHNNYVGICW